MNVFSPKEIPALTEQIATEKIKSGFYKTSVLGFLAGAYIAMGGLLSILIGNGFPGIAASNPGLQKLLAGATFPVGLILVVIAGAELFTGNNATLIAGACNRRYSWLAVLRNWTIVYFSNFAGTMFFVYFFIQLTGVVNSDPWHTAAINIAIAKTSHPWHVVFLKGIGANWLVCLAIWQGLSATSTTGKIIGLWWPVMCFVAIGYEHCIANMFYIPLGIMQGAPIEWIDFIQKNLIPATLGNIVGGGFFVGTLYWYTYGRKNGSQIKN